MSAMDPAKVIKVYGQLTYSEIYEGSLRTTLHATRFILVPVLVFAAFSLGSLFYEKMGGDRDSAFVYWGEVFVSMLYAAPFLFIFLLLIPFIRSRRVYKAEQMSGRRRYLFSPDGIAAETPLGNATVKWGAYRYVIETERLFLLYAQASFANIVPKRCFRNEDDLSSFRALGKDKLPRSKFRNS